MKAALVVPRDSYAITGERALRERKAAERHFQAPFRPVPSKLVIKLQSELDLSRIVRSIASRSNLAEV
jgi:hypothetical protein